MARTAYLPCVQYLSVEDVMVCLGVGRSKAYEVIRDLNDELEKDGFITIAGRIPERKLRERLYLRDNIRPIQATVTKPGTTKKRR